MEHLALIASTATCIAAVIRFTSVARAGSLTGLAAGFLWLGLISNVGWAGYGVFANVPAQILPSVLFLITFTYALVRLHRSGRSQRRNLLWAVPCIAAVAVLSIGVPDAAGLLAGALGIASTTPQLVRIWVTADTSGVGPVAWLASLGIGASWTAYGVADGLAPVWLPNLVFCLLVVGILAGWVAARLRQRPPVLHPESP